jgi:hypothetical protein
VRREKPMMGAPGWESWSDSESDRGEDEEPPSAEHEAALGSIGEFTHDENLFHTQGMSSLPTNRSPLVPSPPTPPETPDPNQLSRTQEPTSPNSDSPLTESQQLIHASLPGSEADRMATVFRHSNKHGLVKTLQRYDTRQNPTDQTQDAHAPKPSHPMSALQEPTVGLPSTLSAQDILDGLSVSKAENMARVLRHVNKE